jgi:hypothetical protein
MDFLSEIRALFAEVREAAIGMEEGPARRAAAQQAILDAANDEVDRIVEGDTLSVFTDAVPRVLRYAMVMATFTAIETSLDTICGAVSRERRFDLTVADIRGTGIVRAHTYLTKMAGLNLDHLAQDWAELRDWQRLRNCIAHANGQVSRMSEAKDLRRASIVSTA